MDLMEISECFMFSGQAVERPKGAGWEVCKNAARLASVAKTRRCLSAGGLGDEARVKRIKTCRVNLGATRGACSGV